MIRTKDLIATLDTWMFSGKLNNLHKEYKYEIIKRLELHDAYKEGIENLLERMREWIEEASR